MRQPKLLRLDDVLEDFRSSPRAYLGQPVSADKETYVHTVGNRRTVDPAITFRRALNCLRSSSYPIRWSFVEDQLVPHVNVCARIDQVPRQHRLGHMCYGKGADLVHALASAACETLERITTWPQEGEMFITVSRKELAMAGVPALEPSSFPISNVATSHNPTYNERVSLRWVPGWSLLENELILVPRLATHLLPVDDVSEIVLDNRANGTAAGNTPAEAAVHGLCELIERDAVCIFTCHMLPARNIDPASIRNPLAVALYRRFVDAGLQVILKDFTTDVRVPVIYALAFDPSRSAARGPTHAWGCGCDLEPELAVLRALTELSQDRATATALMRRVRVTNLKDNQAPLELVEYIGRCYPGSEARFAHLRRPGATVSLQDLRFHNNLPTNPTEELSVLCERVHFAGLNRVVAVNLTCFGSEISVVRIIAPEFEFLPWVAAGTRDGRKGRLAEVPHKLGFVEGVDYRCNAGVAEANLLV